MKVNVKILVTAGVILAMLIVSAAIFKALSFHVISTNPAISALDVETPFLDINYSQKLASNKSLLVSSSPKIVNSYVAEGKTLDIVLAGPLSTTTTYKIVVSNVVSIKGKQIPSEVFIFKPIYVNPSSLPADQVNSQLQQQEQDAKSQTINNADPILSHLPYSTLSFSLNASQIKPSLILSASLYIPAADENGGTSAEQTAVNDYEQEVTSYISSLGLNPSSYDIQYNVVSAP